MLLTLIGLFILVALAGTALAMHELRGRKLPLPVGLLHGVAAVILIVLLVIHDLHEPHNLLVNSATVLFVLTATGGLLLFMFRAMRQPLPGFVVMLHAGFAVASIVLLSIGYIKG
ncbi:MAG TPA: hypothetical protein VFK12_01800 [Gammaproteobacteria bacterium]|jgi:hypothetical protein|nr:hypothetical protein [Gammaproteobacteria bacterium]